MDTFSAVETSPGPVSPERRPTCRTVGRPVTLAPPAARDLQVEHIVHNLDGQIHERSSYGNDPRDVKG